MGGLRAAAGTWLHRLVALLVAPHVRREVLAAEERLAALTAQEAQAAYERGRAALLGEPLVFGARDRVEIAPTAALNDALLNTSSGTITIGPYAMCGHRVSIITGTHDIAERGLARQLAVPPEGRDIVIEEGAWIGTGAIVLGPCRIGAHAVVAAGSVVRADVEPGTIVAGVPARFVRKL